MSGDVKTDQTVCIKYWTNSNVTRLEGVIKATKGLIRHAGAVPYAVVPDKDPACAGKFLVYANYSSSVEARNARDILKVCVNDKWPGAGLDVMLKVDMCNPIYFALYVPNTPTGTKPKELEDVFAKYGPLHKSMAVCAIKDKETEFFVNFKTYAGANAAHKAAQDRDLRLDGSILTANPARNTKYINTLIQSASALNYSFSMEDAKRVGEEMTDNWPRPSDIEALLKAVPQHFVLDRKDKRFLVIDRNAPIAPAAAPPPSVPRPCSPEATSEERANLSDMNVQVHDSFDLLHQLFLRLWYDVKGAVWTDSDSDGLWSISAEQLMEELGYQQLPPEMLRPIQDWELGHLATALTATSLKARLNGIIVRSNSRDVDAQYERYMMLVNYKLMSHGDLLTKYGPTFAAVRTSAAQAVQTVRFLRNILCHRSGSVKGLSAACFACLRDLLSEALSTLGAALLHLKQPVPESLWGEDQSEMGVLEQAMEHERAEPLFNALETGSTCSSSSTEVAQGVEQWTVEQVFNFFLDCKFPTGGVIEGQVNGKALLMLCDDADAEAVFTTSVENGGMGFNRLMFRFRFKTEMAKVRPAADAAAAAAAAG